MKKQEKIFTVANLAESLRQAKTVVLADYRGLDVPQMTKLRRLVKEAGGQLLVIKNTLLTKALEQAGLPLPSESESLTGPTAIVSCFEDEIAPVKAIFEFARQQGLPTFKSGLFEGRVLTKEEVEKLGQLPDKNELAARVIGLLSSPSYKLVNVLTGNQKKLVYILSQKAKS